MPAATAARAAMPAWKPQAPATPEPASAAGSTTVGCPACGQPMARGARRCPACGQRLLVGVPVRRATTLLGSGLLAGVLVGGLLVGAVLPRDTATASGSDTGPTASGPALKPVSPNAAAALRGTTALNGRLAGEAPALAAALATTSFPAQDAIEAFRRMSIDVRSASAMVGALGPWTDAATHQAALAAFYERLGGQINDALAASASSTESYRSATSGILATLRQITQLDAEARSLAAGSGIELPAVTIPPALR